MSSLNSIKVKNVESVKMLLEIAFADGNGFVEEWSTVVQCISLIDKIQQQGILNELDTVKFKSLETIYDAISSQSVTLSVDRLFAKSQKLSSKSILHFVESLCCTSWDEIISSSDEAPRMYSLQRLVEIGHYNMKRIRVEWLGLWNILGPHLNQVITHKNINVSYFALDKLRQLAIKFLDIEELDNYKFQKDFLNPFTVALIADVKIRDMSLTCLSQMVQSKSNKLKSGWKAILAALQAASVDSNGKNCLNLESIIVLAFSILKTIDSASIPLLLANHALNEYISCIVSFCKNSKFPKVCLQAVDLLRNSLDVVQAIAVSKPNEVPSVEQSISNVKQLIDESFNYDELIGLETSLIHLPILFGFAEAITSCDIEVRTRFDLINIGHLLTYLT